MNAKMAHILLNAPKNHYHDGVYGYRVEMKGQRMEELHIPLRDFKKTLLLTKKHKKEIQETMKKGRQSKYKVKGEIVVYKQPMLK